MRYLAGSMNLYERTGDQPVNGLDFSGLAEDFVLPPVLAKALDKASDGSLSASYGKNSFIEYGGVISTEFLGTELFVENEIRGEAHEIALNRQVQKGRIFIGSFHTHRSTVFSEGDIENFLKRPDELVMIIRICETKPIWLWSNAISRPLNWLVSCGTTLRA
jgi:hypothetical protein